MRVTNDMIDPELRSVARFGRIVFRPSIYFFKLVHFLDRAVMGRDVPGLAGEEHALTSIDGGPSIRTRVFRPADHDRAHKLPGVLFLHGGGYAIGRPELTVGLYQDLMAARECVFVAPDYRKSLDAPYPAAANDCYAALVWMKENAERLGIRDDQLVVMGQSAGGGLTAAVTMMARDRGEVRVAAQLPLYPMIDDRNDSESARDNDAPMWNAKHNRLGWDLYLGDLTGEDVPKYAAPARETDYSNLPPTATFVGDLDPFRDETLTYVENLRAAGVPVECEVYEGCFHGFDVAESSAVAQKAKDYLLEQFVVATTDRVAPQA